MVWQKIRQFFQGIKSNREESRSPKKMANTKIKVIQNLMEKGNYKDALPAIQSIEKNTSLNDYEKLCIKVWKTRCWIDHLHEYNNAMYVTKEMIKTIPETGDYPFLLIENIIVLLNCYWHYDTFDLQFKTALEKAENSLENAPNTKKKEYYKAHLLKLRGLYLSNNDEDPQIVLNYYNNSLSIFKKFNNTFEIGDTYDLIGQLYQNKG
jgi:tetratricopeptide (TPR) repeat protein